MKAFAIVDKDGKIVFTESGSYAIFPHHGTADMNCIYSSKERVKEYILTEKQNATETSDDESTGC